MRAVKRYLGTPLFGLAALLAGALASTPAEAQPDSCQLSARDSQRFQREHIPSGPPTPGPIIVRRGYVMQYDAAQRVPRWVAWQARQEFRTDIPRRGRWDAFRPDPQIERPVVDDDYDDIYEDGAGYARGHMAPYFISGGDRNDDGRGAAHEQTNRRTTWSVSDPFDACTVFEINYMSNVAPQFHNRFNGAGGLWYALETIERDRILPRGVVLQIIAGTIFRPGHDHVGPNEDIGVPDLFYRILVTPEGAVPFLFVHNRRIDPTGCDLDAQLETCIVTVADIERLAGADFFPDLDEDTERRLESSDGQAIWQALTAAPAVPRPGERG